MSAAAGGGAAPKRLGREFERACKRELEQQGYWVTQTPTSNDAGVDLVAIKPGQILAVQCKRAGYLAPADRLALYGFTRWGMVPILASRELGGTPARWVIAWRRLVDPNCMDSFKLDQVVEDVARFAVDDSGSARYKDQPGPDFKLERVQVSKND